MSSPSSKDKGKVRLRVADVADLDALGPLYTDPEEAGRFQWFGFGTTRALQARIEQDGSLSDTGGLLVAEHEGRVIGQVMWMRVYHGGAVGSWSWEIATAVLRSARGGGLATEATQLLVDYLFSVTTVHRIQVQVDVDNGPAQKVLKKLGFAVDGVVREALFREGEWRSVTLFSRLRTD